MRASSVVHRLCATLALWLILFPTLADAQFARAPGRPQTFRAGLIVASGYQFTNAEAAAFVYRTNPAASDAVKAAYDGFVTDMKTGFVNATNNWTGWDFLEVAAPDASFRNILGNTARDATYSTDAPIVSPLYGPTSNGFTSYVEVPLAPSGATSYTRDDAAILVVNRNPDAKGSSSTGIVGLAGTGSTGNSVVFNPRTSTTSATLRLNDTAASSMIASGNVTDATGTHLLVRVTGGIKRYYKNGVKQGSDVTGSTSVALQSVNFRLGYGLGVYQEDQYLVFGAGRSRTDNEAADIHAAVSRFKTALAWAALTITTSTVGSPTAQVTLPDIATTNATVSGKGFNPTGADLDREDFATFWVSDYGKETQGFSESSFTPRIVHINAARTTIIGTPIDLIAAGVTGTAGAQGLMERTDTHALRVVDRSGKVYEIAKTGGTATLIGTFASVNGGAWDSDLNQMILATTSQIKWYNADGTNPTIQPVVNLAAPYSANVDQISYDSAQKAVYATGGPNGSAAFILRIAKNDQNYGWWRPSAAITLTGDNQIEAHVRYGGTLYSWDDSYGHGSGGSGFNHTATRTDPFP